MTRLSLLLAASVALTGCAPPALREIQAVRTAKVLTSEGTTRIMGGVSLGEAASKASFEAMAVSLRVADGSPLPGAPEAAVQKNGHFTVDRVPVGQAMRVQGTFAFDGQPVALERYLRPTESLSCARIDLASTLISQKLLSSNPLVSADEALEGAQLFELVNPAKLEVIETSLRKAIETHPSITPEEIVAAIRAGNTSAIFDLLMSDLPDLAALYQGMFDRPDSSLGIRISGVGRNTAPVPGTETSIVFGVISLAVQGSHPETLRIEYWLNGRKILESSPGQQVSLNTWEYPNQPHSLETVAILPGGRKEVLSRTYLVIRNTLDLYCPL